MSAWTIPSYAEWTVPGYTEDRLLGHGVSGRVVAAVNEATGQRVAIKYFDASLVSHPEFLQGFRAETERLKSLDAAHMVRLFDYVEEPGQGAAIVMELVDGVSLRQVITRSGPLSAVAALVMVKDSLIGLAAAHSRRVPHRDLKPDNVLIDADGWCTLTDFGVAVRADKQMPGPGTPAYMAPELWHGAPNVPATDIYAATAVLFESVSGKPPFSGRLGQLRHLHESAPVPLDGLDQPLRDLVAWGMAKNPADRPGNTRSFVNEIAARAATAYGPSWEDEGRRELAERAAALPPLLAGGVGSALATRRKLLAYVSVAAAAMVVIGSMAEVALSKKSDSVQVSSSTTGAFAAQVTVTPPVSASRCTSATAFTYGSTVTATAAGSLSYQWLYSSGKPGPVQTLNFTAAGSQHVSGGTVKATKAGSGWAEIKMLNPAAKISNEATYKLLCTTANSEIALSASVQPAVQTVPSCAAAAPALTATGTITSKKTGKVSYYWALADGQNTAAGTVAFATPGTKAVTPLAITPPALPAAGDAVLVVTSPVAATSSPAAYTVSCTVPVRATATPSAHASSPSATRSSAKPSASPGKTTATPTPTATKASPKPTATTPTPTPTPTTPTPTPTTPTPTPTTPTPTPTTPTPTPTTPTPTPAGSKATGAATATVTTAPTS